MQLNRYRHTFHAKCPENGDTIVYFLIVDSSETIMVERIAEAARLAGNCPKPYHENIADMLFEAVGGSHYLRAHHHGTTIETYRS